MERAENKDIETCLSILRSALKDFHRLSLTQEDMRSRPLLAFLSKKKSVETVIDVDNEAEVKRDEYEAFCANASEEISDYNISI